MRWAAPEPSDLGLAPRDMIVGDVGQLGKNRKGADQQQDVRLAQAAQPVHRRCRDRLAGAMLAHRLAADILHQLEGLVAMLLADHLAQQPAQQADGRTVCRIGWHDGGPRISASFTLLPLRQETTPGPVALQ